MPCVCCCEWRTLHKPMLSLAQKPVTHDVRFAYVVAFALPLNHAYTTHTNYAYSYIRFKSI